MSIIQQKRSIIPACDLHDVATFQHILSKTIQEPSIGAYKIGFTLGLTYGLAGLVSMVRKAAEDAGVDQQKVKVIYDHQKAGTDIPDMGQSFAKVCKKAGIDAVIFFPQAGPVTEEAWIKAAQDAGLGVIVGGKMTHKGYSVSEGGFIEDEAAYKMYSIAAKLGVTDFVVPGNKPDVVIRVRSLVSELTPEPTFYAPGFVAQGGSISDAARVAGDRWHAIVGRAIMDPEVTDKAAAVKELGSQLLG